MKKGYTHIAVILDRTGSMQSIRDDIIGGFNAFLNEQKQQPGILTLTLVQFDTQDPYEVIHDFKLIEAVPELTRATYVPRAATPLLDAIGRGINDIDHQISEMDEDSRPASVVMAIITDGQENSSRKFRRSQIERMIAQKQEMGWQMVFLSADLGAVNDALETGFAPQSTMAFDKTAKGSRDVWAMISNSVSDFRSGVRKQVDFDDEDRKRQQNEIMRLRRELQKHRKRRPDLIKS